MIRYLCHPLYEYFSTSTPIHQHSCEMLHQHVTPTCVTTRLRDAHARSTQSVFQGRDRQVVPPAREQEGRGLQLRL